MNNDISIRKKTLEVERDLQAPKEYYITFEFDMFADVKFTLYFLG